MPYICYLPQWCDCLGLSLYPQGLWLCIIFNVKHAAKHAHTRKQNVCYHLCRSWILLNKMNYNITTLWTLYSNKKNQYGNISQYLFSWYTTSFSSFKNLYFKENKIILNRLWTTTSTPVGVAIRPVASNWRVPFLAEREIEAACLLMILERRLQNTKPMCGCTFSKTNQGAWTWIQQMQFTGSVTLP